MIIHAMSVKSQPSGRHRPVPAAGRVVRLVAAVIMAAAPGTGVASAQEPAPPGMSLAEAAARRFPQPVDASSLVGRRVLQPLESQPTLGFVGHVVKAAGSGEIEVVVKYGGFLGFFSRPIAVPVDAMVLLGQDMEIVDFTPPQLAKMPTYTGLGFTDLPAHSIIRVGLARPSH